MFRCCFKYCFISSFCFDRHFFKFKKISQIVFQHFYKIFVLPIFQSFQKTFFRVKNCILHPNHFFVEAALQLLQFLGTNLSKKIFRCNLWIMQSLFDVNFSTNLVPNMLETGQFCLLCCYWLLYSNDHSGLRYFLRDP